MIHRCQILLLFLLLQVQLLPQSDRSENSARQIPVVYEAVESSVYELLVELNASGVLDFNPAVLPLSRAEISDLLYSALTHKISLTERQHADINFYLKDFGFERTGTDDLLLAFRSRKDSLFKFGLSPYLEGSIKSVGNDQIMQRGFGISFFSYLGNHLGLYARLNDKGATDDIMAANYLSNEVGGNLKPNQSFFGQEKSFDYSELNGGITYAWKWGHIGLVKERIQWGANQYGANILSGRNPSTVMIDLQLEPTKWLDFKYVHAWLVSEVLDSSRTYLIPGGQRQVFTNKNLAANMFSFKPLKGLRIDFGNSIVYADNGVEPIYLIPLFFFKSADHNNSGAGSNQLGQNAQLYGGLSYAGRKGIWLYTALFVDEVNVGEMFDAQNHTNLYSWKIGGRFNLSSVLDNINVALKGEYTRTNPWTYRHQIPSTTFASNDYGMGHYLGENAQEFGFGIEYRPFRGFKFAMDMVKAEKGPDHEYELVNGNANVTGLEFLSPEVWSRQEMSMQVSYEILNELIVKLTLNSSKVNGVNENLHPLLEGDRTILGLGFKLGL